MDDRFVHLYLCIVAQFAFTLTTDKLLYYPRRVQVAVQPGVLAFMK